VLCLHPAIFRRLCDVTTPDQTSTGQTEPGSGELAPQYVPGEVETRRYQSWVDSGYFTADASSPAPSYTIMIPPRW
jgi:valyl-tRNA synthetase